jgi:surface exclusion protein prgA
MGIFGDFMSNKTIKTLTTSTAIALASVGGTAFAQEATTSTPVSTTAVNEPALVAKSQVKPLEKSEVPAPSTVKPALDAQKAVIKDAEAKVDTAKADVETKKATVASTEKEVATAKQAVKDAEAVASQATPEKVAEVKDAQAKNVEAQTANQKATESVNEQIKAETKTLSDEQAKVATAQATVDQANKDVKTAEQAVSSAQSALDGTGLASAQKDLTQAQTDVKDATKAVEDAKTATKNASKADANRAQAIKSAETDVNTKNDAVKLAKDKLASATEHATNVENKLQSAQAELKSAQDKLANTGASKDIVQIGNPTFHISDSLRDKIGAKSNDITYKDAYELWRANDNETTRRVMRGMAVKMSGASTITIDEKDKNRPVDLNNLTDDQLVEISEFYAKMLTQLNHNFGYNASKKAYVSQKTLDYSKSVAKKYEARALDPRTSGHIPGGLENLTPIGDGSQEQTMYGLKQAVIRAFELSSYEDEPSNWEHLRTNLANQADGSVALTLTKINGEYWMVTTYADFDNDQVITKETDTATLEKAVETAKSNLTQAETASENAKRALTKASTDYASALSLKTEAEKVLADAMAKPLQAQVAENNLRLAEIALANAKKREEKASEAVANFSASLADKKSALEKAQAELEAVKVVQKSASQSLADATAKLRAQEAKVNSLKAQSDKLIAEKDTLVKEAKKLAEQLQAYLDAPAKLATAKDEQAKAEAKLAQVKAELTTAQSTLETLLSAYRTEHAKLVDLQTEYDALVDLAEKAQEHVVAKLPDGTVIAVPKVAPTAEALPEVNIAELQKALATGKEVTLDAQGKVVVKEKRETYSAPAVKPVENEKMSYSRVEKSKTLPNTGETSSVVMLVFGAILGTFGLVTVRRKN